MQAEHRRSTTSRRLFAAFGAILALFAAALAVELVTLRRIGDAEEEVARVDQAKHAGHMAAAQVRDQYIHQAHTLIEFSTGHVAHYARVVVATRETIAHLEELAATPREQLLAAQIARLADENDRDFRTTVLPAIARGDRSGLVAMGEQLEAVVDRVVEINAEINASFEARNAGARARADRLRGQALLATLVCFGLAIVLAGAVGLWLTRFIVGRLQPLQQGARRVGAGDLSTRIALTGADEFSELAAAFNRMAESLAGEQAALVRSQKLASIGQVAAGVAHELNNPLAVILGYAKVLRRQAEGPLGDELRIIEDEATQCQRIVQGLLDLARPQQLEVEAIDVAELAREAIGRLDDAGALHGLTVDVTAPVPVVVAGDAGKLRQVIANIVVNAADAATPTGRVQVEVHEDGPDAVLTVTDDGPGIPLALRAQVFDPFFTTKRDGTGLGLAIAQAMANAHGGRISIAAVASPGTGTRISLHLPRPAAASPTP